MTSFRLLHVLLQVRVQVLLLSVSLQPNNCDREPD